VLELIEGSSGPTAVSPSFQLYLTRSSSAFLKLRHASPRLSTTNSYHLSHLLLGVTEHPGPASDVLFAVSASTALRACLRRTFAVLYQQIVTRSRAQLRSMRETREDISAGPDAR